LSYHTPKGHQHCTTHSRTTLRGREAVGWDFKDASSPRALGIAPPPTHFSLLLSFLNGETPLHHLRPKRLSQAVARKNPYVKPGHLFMRTGWSGLSLWNCAGGEKDAQWLIRIGCRLWDSVADPLVVAEKQV